MSYITISYYIILTNNIKKKINKSIKSYFIAFFVNVL